MTRGTPNRFFNPARRPPDAPWQPSHSANLSAPMRTYNQVLVGEYSRWRIKADLKERTVLFRIKDYEHRLVLQRLRPGQPIAASDVLRAEFRERRRGRA